MSCHSQDKLMLYFLQKEGLHHTKKLLWSKQVFHFSFLSNPNICPSFYIT